MTLTWVPRVLFFSLMKLALKVSWLFIVSVLGKH